nr:MAG TPA: hypothetical protein [Caudoviricetes sp.]
MLYREVLEMRGMGVTHKILMEVCCERTRA